MYFAVLKRCNGVFLVRAFWRVASAQQGLIPKSSKLEHSVYFSQKDGIVKKLETNLRKVTPTILKCKTWTLKVALFSLLKYLYFVHKLKIGSFFAFLLITCQELLSKKITAGFN